MGLPNECVIIHILYENFLMRQHEAKQNFYEKPAPKRELWDETEKL